jgi:hypothetical protein
MEMNEGKPQANNAGCGDAAVKTRKEQIRDKARELGQTYFPDSANIWARSNVEAAYVESACVEMAEWVDRHPHWIPVEEELPTVGEIVQIYVEDLDDVVYGALQLTGDWWCEEYGCNFSNITYWMRKPKPPRKEE